MAETVIAVPSPMTKVDATPVQNSALRQSKDENDDRARTGSQADGDDGVRPASTSATAQVARLRRVGMAPGVSLIVMVVVVGGNDYDRDDDHGHARGDAHDRARDVMCACVFCSRAANAGRRGLSPTTAAGRSTRSTHN